MCLSLENKKIVKNRRQIFFNGAGSQFNNLTSEGSGKSSDDDFSP